MSLPSHLRALISSAADRVRRDRRAAHHAARAALRDAARKAYRQMSVTHDDDVVVHADIDGGFCIAWQSDGVGAFGPEPEAVAAGGTCGAWLQWMETAYARDGEHPARVAHSVGFDLRTRQWDRELVKRWIWPTEAAALAAIASFAGPARSAS